MGSSIGQSLIGNLAVWDGSGTPPVGSVPTFNASGGITTGSLTRSLPITSIRGPAGLIITGTTVATTWAISGTTVGASLSLLSTGAKNTTITPSGFFEVVVPNSYTAGAAMTVAASALFVANSGTGVTATLAPSAYVMSDGGTIAGSNLITASAQTLSSSAATLTFPILGTGVTPGGRIVLGLGGTVAETGNAGSGSQIQVNSVTLTS